TVDPAARHRGRLPEISGRQLHPRSAIDALHILNGETLTDNRIRYEDLETGIVRIVLARPETRNSQDTRMLYALNDAFDQAARDDTVKVIILAADGPHFSSGHDLRESPDGVM